MEPKPEPRPEAPPESLPTPAAEAPVEPKPEIDFEPLESLEEEMAKLLGRPLNK